MSVRIASLFSLVAFVVLSVQPAQAEKFLWFDVPGTEEPAQPPPPKKPIQIVPEGLTNESAAPETQQQDQATQRKGQSHKTNSPSKQRLVNTTRAIENQHEARALLNLVENQLNRINECYQGERYLYEDLKLEADHKRRWQHLEFAQRQLGLTIGNRFFNANAPLGPMTETIAVGKKLDKLEDHTTMEDEAEKKLLISDRARLMTELLVIQNHLLYSKKDGGYCFRYGKDKEPVHEKEKPKANPRDMRFTAPILS